MLNVKEQWKRLIGNGFPFSRSPEQLGELGAPQKTIGNTSYDPSSTEAVLSRELPTPNTRDDE